MGVDCVNNFDEFDEFDKEEEFDSKNEYDDFDTGKEKKSIIPFIIVSIIVILIILILWGVYSSAKKKANKDPEPNTITMQESVEFKLNGEEKITLKVGEVFVDPGFTAASSTNGNLNTFVETTGGVDINVVGVYEITYTLIYDGTTRVLVRTIEVVQEGGSQAPVPEPETPVDNLNSDLSIALNGASSLYIFRGMNYQDSGAKATNKEGVDVSGNIVVTGGVDTSKTGSYTITYSITNSSNQTKSVSRKVEVLDMVAEIKSTNEYYTNKDIELVINVNADRFSHIILPNGQKTTNSYYTYKVSSNQSYVFQVFNEVGLQKNYTYTVKNIDKEIPTGSCKITHESSGSKIVIDAKDNIGISLYGYGGKTYNTNTLTFPGYFKQGLSVEVAFYDKAGNMGKAKCTSPSR